jgi:hypothetical protein
MASARATTLRMLIVTRTLVTHGSSIAFSRNAITSRRIRSIDD